MPKGAPKKQKIGRDIGACHPLGGETPFELGANLVPVRKLMKPGKTRATGTIAAEASLKAALNLMLASRRSSLCVADERGARLGEVHLSDIVARRDRT